MIQLSLVFTVVLSLVLLMVIASPAGVPGLGKEKSLCPVPQYSECHRWCEECFELDVADRTLCLSYLDMIEWDAVNMKMGIEFPFCCFFSFRFCLDCM